MIKYLLLIFTFSCLNAQVKSDSASVKDNIITLEEVTEVPKFVAGNEGLRKYLATHLSSVKPSRDKGKVTIKVFFFIDKDGRVKDVFIPKRHSKSLNEENLKLIYDVFNNMPLWIPGHLDGKPKGVRMAQMVTIGI